MTSNVALRLVHTAPDPSSGERAMQLLSYVERYALNHEVGRGQREQLRVTAKLLTRFAGGELAVEDLDEDLVNRWFVERLESGLSRETVRGNRTRILSLWRAAAEDGIVRPPGKLRPVKWIQCRPQAFTDVQLRSLIDQANLLKGDCPTLGVKRSAYWRSYVLAAYDSGVRRGDLLALERPDIEDQPDGSGIVSFVQSKTGRIHRVRFRPETMRAIDECMASGPPRKKIWPNFGNPKRWFMWFRKLCDRAGFGGSSKWIRRSSASYMAKDLGPDTARKHLGHATVGIAERHYFDPNIVDGSPPLPPALSGQPSAHAIQVCYVFGSERVSEIVTNHDPSAVYIVSTDTQDEPATVVNPAPAPVESSSAHRQIKAGSALGASRRGEPNVMAKTPERSKSATVNDGDPTVAAAEDRAVESACANIDGISLTLREREVLLLICADCGPKEIARRLGIAWNTAKRHREKLRKKLGGLKTVGMVSWAIRNGLFKPQTENRRPIQEVLRNPLSQREEQILRFICDDLKPQEIARRLQLTVHTVDAYRQILRAKLNGLGTGGMVRWAIRAGLIEP